MSLAKVRAKLTVWYFEMAVGGHFGFWPDLVGLVHTFARNEVFYFFAKYVKVSESTLKSSIAI